MAGEYYDGTVWMQNDRVCNCCYKPVGMEHDHACPRAGVVGDPPPEHIEVHDACGGVDDAPPTFDDKLRLAGEEITQLVRDKNRAYGNSVNKTIDQLNSLFPNGIKPEQYRDLLLMIRVLDKFNRLADGDKTAFGESPWRDIAGYGIIGMAQEQEGL